MAGGRDRTRARRALATALALGLAGQAGTAAAAAWTQAQGHGQLVLSFDHTLSTREYGADRHSAARPGYSKTELFALMEYGLSDRVTLILTPSLQHVRSEGAGQQNGLGYTDLGVRYRVYEGDGWVGAVQGLVRLPHGGTRATQPQISDSDVQYDLRGLLGDGFKIGGHDAFVDAEAGYRFRMGAPTGEYHLDLTFGYHVTPKLQLIAQTLTTVSNGAPGPGTGSYDYTKLQISAAYELTPATTVQIGAVSTVAGRNALRERGVLLGLWHRF